MLHLAGAGLQAVPVNMEQSKKSQKLKWFGNQFIAVLLQGCLWGMS
jgi:hypothetical protein